MEDDTGVSEKTVGDLIASLAALTKNLGADDLATVAVAERVQQARQRRDADKPLLTKVQAAARRRDKAQKALGKATAAEAAAKDEVLKAQQEAAKAAAAVLGAQKLLGQEAAALAELQDALAKDSAAKARAAGYRDPVAEPALLAPGAAALLANCVDPKLHEALNFVQTQVQARHRQEREAAQQEADREQQMADKADAGTAVWREEMAAAAVALGSHLRADAGASTASPRA